MNIYTQTFEGMAPVRRLTNCKYNQHPKSLSPDGKVLIYTEIHPETLLDIWMLEMDGDTVSKPFLKTNFSETQPILSPNGRWIVYVSNEQGEEQIFICSFPGKKSKIQITKTGGIEPLWAPDGKEIYYKDPSGSRLMAVPFFTDPEVYVGESRILFKGKFKASPLFGPNYDITPDGKKFLMIEEEEKSSRATQINVILNWAEDLKRLVPIDN